MMKKSIILLVMVIFLCAGLVNAEKKNKKKETSPKDIIKGTWTFTTEKEDVSEEDKNLTYTFKEEMAKFIVLKNDLEFAKYDVRENLLFFIPKEGKDIIFKMELVDRNSTMILTADEGDGEQKIFRRNGKRKKNRK